MIILIVLLILAGNTAFVSCVSLYSYFETYIFVWLFLACIVSSILSCLQ